MLHHTCHSVIESHCLFLLLFFFLVNTRCLISILHLYWDKNLHIMLYSPIGINMQEHTQYVTKFTFCAFYHGIRALLLTGADTCRQCLYINAPGTKEGNGWTNWWKCSCILFCSYTPLADIGLFPNFHQSCLIHSIHDIHLQLEWIRAGVSLYVCAPEANHKRENFWKC